MSFLSYQKKQTKKQLHAVSQNNHQPINISASQRAVYTSGCEPIGVGEKRSPSETRGSRIAAYCSPSETRGGLEMSTCARAGSCATLEGASSSVAGSTAAYGTPFSSDDKGTTCEPELLGGIRRISTCDAHTVVNARTVRKIRAGSSSLWRTFHEQCHQQPRKPPRKPLRPEVNKLRTAHTCGG